MGTRIEKIRTILTQSKLDAFLITTPSHITYLTHFDFLSPTEREAYVVITPKKQYIISSFLYKEEIIKVAPQFIFLDISSPDGKPFWKYVADILAHEASQQVGFEPENLTVSEYTVLQKQKLHLSPSSISSIRQEKDPGEIARIAKACSIGDQAFTEIQKDIYPGMTEKEVAFLLDAYMRSLGAEPAFATIVAFGKNAAIPHHKTDTTVLKKTDSILLDFGAKFDMYCSDMTRMLFVGKPSKEIVHAHKTLYESQQRAYALLLTEKLPIAASSVDIKAREYLREKGYPDFPHSLGHSIGLEPHDGFRLSPSSQTSLTKGMVFSIEPGIYLPGRFGMRIEDIVVLTKKGPELLTTSSRELLVI